MSQDGPVQVASFIFPLVSELTADPLQKDGELIELIFSLLLAKEVETGVVIDVVFFGVFAKGSLYT